MSKKETIKCSKRSQLSQKIASITHDRVKRNASMDHARSCDMAHTPAMVAQWSCTTTGGGALASSTLFDADLGLKRFRARRASRRLLRRQEPCPVWLRCRTSHRGSRFHVRNSVCTQARRVDAGHAVAFNALPVAAACISHRLVTAAGEHQREEHGNQPAEGAHEVAWIDWLPCANRALTLRLSTR